MVSVKKITSEGQTTMSRKCKDDARAIDNESDKSFEDDADDGNWINVENVRKNKKKVAVVSSAKRRMGPIDKNKKKARNVRVTHNAVDKDLNMAKQYKIRYDCCIKELIKVDKKNGSASKEKQRYVKLEFQTGMFEAMKKNMVNIMKDKFKVNFVEGKDPKVETYGKAKAEERYIFDLMFQHENAEYTLQVTVFNTNCTMGINSVGKTAHAMIKTQTSWG